MDNESLKKLAMDYQATFGAPTAEAVLEDLAVFCKHNRVTFVVDDPHGRESAFREGRREVYLRIQELLRLEIDKIDERQQEVIYE